MGWCGVERNTEGEREVTESLYVNAPSVYFPTLHNSISNSNHAAFHSKNVDILQKFGMGRETLGGIKKK